MCKRLLASLKFLELGYRSAPSLPPHTGFGSARPAA